VPSAGTALQYEPSFFDRYGDPQGAHMRLRETGAGVVHMNDSGSIENASGTAGGAAVISYGTEIVKFGGCAISNNYERWRHRAGPVR
jgi:hypothetical protein